MAGVSLWALFREKKEARPGAVAVLPALPQHAWHARPAHDTRHSLTVQRVQKPRN